MPVYGDNSVATIHGWKEVIHDMEEREQETMITNFTMRCDF